MKIFSVILAGGIGTRLWPLSNSYCPKQFITQDAELSTFQKAILRNKLQPDQHYLILANQQCLPIVRSQLGQIQVSNFTLIVEPMPKNTAPALIAAAIYLSSRYRNAKMLVAPADHEIETTIDYQKQILSMLNYLDKNFYITLGIKPHRPEVSYGYIRVTKELSRGIYNVDQFIEKPNLHLAQQFARSESYLWNCGIFIFGVKRFLHEMQYFEPKMYLQVLTAFSKARFCPLG
jgi:mannose-1-phosphate guanylyltransferase